MLPMALWSTAGDSSRRASILPVPTLGYSPETRGYIGAVVQLAFRTDRDTNTRFSAAKTEIQYTQNRQFIFEAGCSIFTPGESWLLNAGLHASRFPDFWWGTGIDAPESMRQRFNSNRTRIEFAALRRWQSRWFAGPALKYQQYNQVEFLNSAGSVSSRTTSLKALAAGLQSVIDSRDNILNPGQGYFLDVQSLVTRSGNNLLSLRWSADYRHYRSISKRLVLAGRIYGQAISGETVFYDLSLYGGDRFMRGYYFGRFRDQNMWLAAAEARYRIYRRWGAALFGGTGTVGYTPGQAITNPMKPAWGLGLRFQADRRENINLRIDYARGRDGQSGFYFAFGEAF